MHSSRMCTIRSSSHLSGVADPAPMHAGITTPPKGTDPLDQAPPRADTPLDQAAPPGPGTPLAHPHRVDTHPWTNTHL